MIIFLHQQGTESLLKVCRVFVIVNIVLYDAFVVADHDVNTQAKFSSSEASENIVHLVTNTLIKMI